MKPCRIIRGDEGTGHRGEQGLDYSVGFSAESSGAEEE